MLFLQRNGANYSVFLNVANEFDGSDSGARPDEAISWGKIRMDAKPVKVCEQVVCVTEYFLHMSVLKIYP